MLGIAVALALPVLGEASVIYTYTGNNFDTITDESPPAGTYTTDMRVTASFELAEPLALDLVGADVTSLVLSYSASDGRTAVSGGVLPPGSPVPNLWHVSTNSTGDITEWIWQVAGESNVDIGDQTFTIVSVNGIVGPPQDNGQFMECVALPCPTGGPGAGWDNGSIQLDPGTWDVVPEPSTSLLVGFGLVGLAMKRRRVARL